MAKRMRGSRKIERKIENGGTGGREKRRRGRRRIKIKEDGVG